MLTKKDIKLFLETQKKAVIKWDGLEYYVYPKHIIDACLKK